MNFFKKTPVAVILTLLLVALCCVWGYTRVYLSDLPTLSSGEEHHTAGESNLNYYLDQVDDDAGLFSLETLDAIARHNLEMDNQYDSILKIQTVSDLDGVDIKTFTMQQAQAIKLSGRDILLVLDAGTKDWYVTYGQSIQAYVEKDQELSSLCRRHLDEDFFTTGTNQEILAFFGNLRAWYGSHVPEISHDANSIFYTESTLPNVTLGAVVRGILFTLLANLWWIILLLLILNGLDHFRLDRYLSRAAQNGVKRPFHPFLFWHHMGSKWYSRMSDPNYGNDEDQFDDDAEDNTGFNDGYYTGAGFNGGPNGSDNGAGFNGGPNDSGNGAGFNGGPNDSGNGAGFNGGPNDSGNGAGFNGGPNDSGNGAGFNGGAYDFNQGPGGFNQGPFDQGPGGFQNGPGGFNGGPNGWNQPQNGFSFQRIWQSWRQLVQMAQDIFRGNRRL